MATNLSAARRTILDSDIANRATRRGKFYGNFREQRLKHDNTNTTTYHCRDFTLGNPDNGGDAAICHLFTPGVEVHKMQGGPNNGKHRVTAAGKYLYGFNKDDSGNRYEMTTPPRITFFLIFGKVKPDGKIDYSQTQEKKAFISDLRTSTNKRTNISGQGFVVPIIGYRPIGCRYEITRRYRTTTAPLSLRGSAKSKRGSPKGERPSKAAARRARGGKK